MNDSELSSGFSTPARQSRFWFQRLLPSRTIASKINLGYVLALGIAVLGISGGFLYSSRYHRQALIATADALEELELAHSLQTELLEIRVHQHNVGVFLDNPKDLKIQLFSLREDMAEFEKVWVEFKNSEGATEGDDEDAGEEAELNQVFLEENEEIPDLYIEEVNLILSQFDLSNISDLQKVILHDRFQKLEKGKRSADLEQFTESLNGLIDRAHEEYGLAEIQLKETEMLRFYLVLGSMIVAIVIAAFAARRTTKSIIHPIHAVASVAQQLTRDPNFNLQAPVLTNDEIGVLATAFNQLIKRVKQLLDEQAATNEKLAFYNLTLEQQVQERTQELNSRNVDLQQMLLELQQAQSHLIQSEKMSSLGQMVAGVAHEINNPVNFIHGNLRYIQEYAENLLSLIQSYQRYYVNPPQEIEEEIEDMDLEFLQKDLIDILRSMRIGTDRICDIVKSMRVFSRLDEAEFKAAEIDAGIDSTLLILQHRLKATAERPAIQVFKDYGDLPPINCYAGQLNQVFMNLIANAIDAVEESLAIRYPLANRQENPISTPGQIYIRTQRLDTNWVRVEIEDNGLGMSESVQQKLFDPFFTTKPVGKGTGLGLAISYQIVVDKHGGKLTCHSAPELGTKFAIDIPINQQGKVTSV